MKTYLALFRGINVGGRNLLPMAELLEIFEQLGLESARSYIQSGNIIFDSSIEDTDRLANTISAAVEELKGFKPEVLVLSKKVFFQAAKTNPFGSGDGKTVHLYFLRDTPVDNYLVNVDQVRSESENCQLIGNIFYLYAPDGIGRSKLVANIDRHLGVTATGRNLNTVSRLVEILESVD